MVLTILLLTVGAANADPVTSVPPQVIFVPIPWAYSVAKHPSRPVLYVGNQGASNSQNLVTFRLNADGSLDPNSQRVCEDYFSADGKTPSFPHRILRPAVDAEKRVLYLAAYPITSNSVTTYGDTNNFEYAVVALDEQGQPARRLRLFRTDVSGQQGLLSIWHEPSLRRLFFNYYSTLHWCDLDANGLPISTKTKYFPNLFTFWQWEYVPVWKLYFAARTDSYVAFARLNEDGSQAEFIQTLYPVLETSWAGYFDLNVPSRLLYCLIGQPGKELAVVRLSASGTPQSLPRYFDIGPTIWMRCDFKAGLLYAFTRESLRVIKLDGNELPTGKPQAYSLACGEIFDLLVDEATGKIYVSCTNPPKSR